MSDDVQFDQQVGAQYFLTAAGAGLLAGVAMGLVLDLVMGMMPAIGGLYGVETTLAGWVSHLWHAAVFGTVFGGVLVLTPLVTHVTRPVPASALGIVWGLVLWVGAAGVIMPLWMGAIGLPAPNVPALNPVSGVGHVLYGFVLGSTLAVTARRSTS